MNRPGKPILVIAGLRVKDGLADEFIKIATPVVEATKNEEGCVRYNMVQDVFDKHAFYFYEEYADENAYYEHRMTDYMEDFRPKREALLDHYLGLEIFDARRGHISQ